MAYSPKSDINEIAYLKREYNNYKKKGDTAGMQFAQDSAKKYYDNLVASGYGAEANYLKGADEKSAFDYSKGYGLSEQKKKTDAYYDSYVDTYKKNVDSAQSSAISAANAQYEAGKLSVDNSYKDAAKAYYNQYLKEKKALPQQLAALGITGGAAESSLIELGNNYLNNLNQAQIQKNQAMADLEAQKAGVLADAEMNRANAENDIARMAYEKMLGDRDFDMQKRQYLDNSWLSTKGFDENKRMNDYQIEDAMYQRGLTERAYNDQQTQLAYERALEAVNTGNFAPLAQLWGITPEEAYQRYMNFIKDSEYARYAAQYGAKAARDNNQYVYTGGEVNETVPTSPSGIPIYMQQGSNLIVPTDSEKKIGITIPKNRDEAAEVLRQYIENRK